MDKIRQYLYYGLIGIISFISLVFLPMLGTTTDIGFKFPNTTAGWLVYIITKLVVAVLNILIFYCFMEQAKVNVKQNEYYIRATELLMKNNIKEYRPKSPREWQKKQYLTKGTTIFISTLLGLFALTQAVLTFDYVSMLTYLFTIIVGVVFGLLQMKKAEEYWTTEYYNYAIITDKENKKNANS